MSYEALIGRTFAGRYRIDALLGKGGMGAVFRATQTTIQRRVALKVLRRELTDDETIIARFRQEAVSVSELVHPNTIRVLDFGQEDGGQLYIVMEFVDGCSLGDLLKGTATLPAERVLRIVSQICKALGEAHVKGTLHRDLKPDNIMLSQLHGEPDFVKVVDFGIAKVMEQGQGDLTATGQILGTPRYMSPEQARALPLDGRSDLYSLAVLTYRMLAGVTPFDQPTPMAMILDHIQTPPPSLQLPEGVTSNALVEFMDRALAKRPEDRPADAKQFLRELENAFGGIAPASATTVRQRTVTGNEETLLKSAPATQAAPRRTVSSPGQQRFGAPARQTAEETLPASTQDLRGNNVGPWIALAALVLALGLGIGAWLLSQRNQARSPARDSTGNAADTHTTAGEPHGESSGAGETTTGRDPTGPDPTGPDPTGPDPTGPQVVMTEKTRSPRRDGEELTTRPLTRRKLELNAQSYVPAVEPTAALGALFKQGPQSVATHVEYRLRRQLDLSALHVFLRANPGGERLEQLLFLAEADDKVAEWARKALTNDGVAKGRHWTVIRTQPDKAQVLVFGKSRPSPVAVHWPADGPPLIVRVHKRGRKPQRLLLDKTEPETLVRLKKAVTSDKPDPYIKYKKQ